MKNFLLRHKKGFLTATVSLCAVAVGALVYNKTVKRDKAMSLAKLQADVEQNVRDTAKLLDPHTTVLEYGDTNNDIFNIVNAYGHNTHLTMNVEEKTAHDDIALPTYEVVDNVDTYTCGEHLIAYKVSETDFYGQTVQKIYPTVYKVEDTQAPVIKLNDTGETTIYSDQTYDVDNLVKSVKDPIDGDLKEYDSKDKYKKAKDGYYVESDYQSGSVGTYTVTIRAKDKNGNTSKETFTINAIARPVKKVEQSSSSSSSYSSSSYSSNSYSSNSYSSYDSGSSSSAAASSSTPYYQEPASYGSYVGDISVGGHWARCYTGWGSGSPQAITDGVGTAYVFYASGKTVIADHNYQGFSAIEYSSTANFAGRGLNKVSAYLGTNTGYDIILEDGRSFYDVYDGDIVMYTCHGSQVYVSFWA